MGLLFLIWGRHKLNSEIDINDRYVGLPQFIIGVVFILIANTINTFKIDVD